jgi:Asp/Glu/hydantoin racemase
MATVGFLHTAPTHVRTFRALVIETGEDLVDVHVVDEALLTDARRHGVDDELQSRVEQHLQQLAAKGAQVIVCTCSSLSGVAESLGPAVGAAVVRIDRPMAERAVAIGGRIAVVVALESTLLPTREVLRESIRQAGSDAVLIEAPCLDAWQLFEAGDTPGYYARLAAHVRDLERDGQADVIVLGQASMAGAIELLDGVRLPVLCSPRLAVTRAVELISPGS